MSQEQLADAAGLTRNSIGHYESGRRAPDLEKLGKIAAALNRDHFEAGDNLRVDFSANGKPHEPVPQQMDLIFDQNNGVNIRIESAGQGVIIRKIAI